MWTRPSMPGFELDEGTVAHHVDDLALDDRSRPGTSASTFSHGLAIFLLQAQRDLFLLAVDVQDLDLDLLVDRDHLGRMADALPSSCR